MTRSCFSSERVKSLMNQSSVMEVGPGSSAPREVMWEGVILEEN